MITADQIKSLLSQKTIDTGVFLVEVQVKPGNSITVYLDKPDGISIGECVEISRYLNANFDRDVEDYNLEVSSPGLGAPFRVKEQYIKNIGKDIEVILTSGKKLVGKLLSFTGDEMEIEVLSNDDSDKKSRKLIPRNIKIDINTVKTTKTLVAFK